MKQKVKNSQVWRRNVTFVKAPLSRHVLCYAALEMVIIIITILILVLLLLLLLSSAKTSVPSPLHYRAPNYISDITLAFPSLFGCYGDIYCLLLSC